MPTYEISTKVFKLLSCVGTVIYMLEEEVRFHIGSGDGDFVDNDDP